MKQRKHTRKTPAPPEPAPPIPPHVLRFLNSLPTDRDPMEWITKFREALRLLLGDVNRIALFINMNCSLLDGVKENRATLLSEITTRRHRDMVYYLQATAVDAQKNLLERYHDHLRQAGFPFHEYQPGHSFLYSMFGDRSHLGILWLFRTNGLTPISPRTLETMEQLRPFMVFVLSHQVARYACAKPESTIFYRIIKDLIRSLQVTPREREVLTLRLMGLQNKTIADKLFISEETVVKHVRKILRKGKSHSFIELFMRYYVPELDDPGFVPPLPPLPPRRTGRKRNDEQQPPASPNTVLVW